MNAVRGVAQERKAFADERAGDPEPERERLTRPQHRDFAEMQAEALLQFRMELGLGQHDDARGLRALLDPDEGGAAVLQRQDCERPRRQEMLDRAAP